MSAIGFDGGKDFYNNNCIGYQVPSTPQTKGPRVAAVHRYISSLSGSDGRCNGSVSHLGGENRNSCSGRNGSTVHCMSILMVFSKEDSQSDAFKQAAAKGGYSYHLAKTSESAIELYMEHRHDLVVIDCRQSKQINYEALCRAIVKTASPNSCTRFLAVTKKCDKDEPSINPLLQAGFTRRLNECLNPSSVYNELLSIEAGELKAQQQLLLFNALSKALENVTESVEVLDHLLTTQYVNNVYERHSGYSASDAIGCDMQEKLQVDNCNEEETLVYHVKKNQVWEGQQSLKRKNGDTVLCKCKVIPVESAPGVHHHVILRTLVQSEGQPIPQWDKYRDVEQRQTHEFRSYRRGSYLSLSSNSEGGLHIRRKESITRFHAMTIEAPINKVINLLNEAQRYPNSSVNIVQAIDRVLEILQTTELFAPLVQQVKEEDPLTNDYVGGLCDQVSLSTSITRHSSTKQNNRLGSGLKLPISTQQITESSDVEMHLRDEANWTFDILKLERMTNKNALVPLGLKIFNRFDALEHLSIDEKTLSNWLHLISENYRINNPYHNATHAADVLQATAYFLDKMRPMQIVNPIEEVGALIAAVIHDVDHPARTSSFLVNSKDKLALLYNDIAVLENHHAAMGFQLTGQSDEVNILKNLEREEYEKLRHNVIDMVLATEMAKHFEHLQKFIHICKPHPKSTDDETSIKSGVTTASEMVISAQENRRQILRMVIKCADVSNPAREQHLCEEWAKRIAEEYFQQTEDERNRDLPVVMPNFDRATCSIPHSQLKFIEVFLLSMFEHWDAFLNIPEVAAQLQSNYNYWKDLDEQQQQQQPQLRSDS